jgi:hypothetical protein
MNTLSSVLLILFAMALIAAPGVIPCGRAVAGVRAHLCPNRRSFRPSRPTPCERRPRRRASRRNAQALERVRGAAARGAAVVLVGLDFGFYVTHVATSTAFWRFHAVHTRSGRRRHDHDPPPGEG